MKKNKVKNENENLQLFIYAMYDIYMCDIEFIFADSVEKS